MLRKIWKAISRLFFFFLISCFCVIQVRAQTGQIRASVPGDSSKTSVNNDSVTVVFLTKADSAVVLVNKNFMDPLFVQHGDSLRIPNNTSLTVSSPYVAKRTIKIMLQDTTRYELSIDAHVENSEFVLRNNVFARYRSGANLTVFTDPETDIYLDDQYLGRSYAQLYVSPEEYNIYLDFPGKSRKKIKIRLNETYMTVVEKRMKPIKSTSTYLSFIPSLSQFYTGRTRRGILYAGVSVLAAASFTTFNSNYKSNRSEFNASLEEFNKITDENRLLTLGNRLESLESKVDRNLTFKNISLGALVLIPIASILDQWFFKPEEGYRQQNRPVEVQFYAGDNASFSKSTTTTLTDMRLSLKFNF